MHTDHCLMVAGSAGILKGCCQRVCSCRSFCPRKARHKPIGYRQNFRRFHNGKTEALIKTYIFTLIRFQVCRGASAIYYHAEGVEHSGADPLPLKNGLDGDRTKMPVRFGWIPPSPLADPIQNTNGCCNRIEDHPPGSHFYLFDHVGMAEARARHSTDPDKSVRANGTKNKPSPMDTSEYRHEKTPHSDGTPLLSRDTEHCHDRWIVTHSSAHKLRRLFK